MKNIATKTLIFIFLLSVCLASAGNVFAQATALDAEGYYNLGVDYGKSGRYQEAIEAYKQSIRLKPDHADAHFNLWVCVSEDRGQRSGSGRIQNIKNTQFGMN